MFFDFAVGEAGASGPPFGLDTIYWIWGDRTYKTPRKVVSPGRTYLVFTTEGRGLIRYDGRTFEVAAGEYLAMRPHQDFGYGCLGEAWRFWWFELAQPQPYLPTERVMARPTGDLIVRLFEQSLRFAKQGRWDIAQSLLQPALMVLENGQTAQDAHPTEQKLAGMERYIREQLAAVNVASLCDHFNMQERTLRNLCHRAFGYAPKKLIERIRLETAQQLLVNTTMTLAQIAAAIGFSSQFHFSRCFRERFLMSPGEYRRQTVL